MAYFDQYFEEISRLITRLADGQRDHIETCIEAMTNSIKAGGQLYIFGAGHSHIAAEEVFIRAGTLTTTQAIWPDTRSDKFERLHGVAELVLKEYDLTGKDCLVVVSNSGINPLPIEMVLGAKKRGTTTIAMTSVAHSQATVSRHQDGLKLHQVADHCLDTTVPAGDALLEIKDYPVRVGPGSTIANVALINALVVGVIESMLAEGLEPPVRMSRNLPGGDAHNDRLEEQFGIRERTYF